MLHLVAAFAFNYTSAFILVVGNENLFHFVRNAKYALVMALTNGW